MNILFWNAGLKGKRAGNIDNVNACLLEMIMEYKIDLLILAEYNANIQSMCNQINTRICKNINYRPIPNLGGCDKIKGIIKSEYPIESLREQNRYQIAKISTSTYQLIIGMVHNVSKMQFSERQQEEMLRMFHGDIMEVEIEHKCKNTIAIGDFNANPFEPSCIGAGMMHALPFVENIINKPERKIQGVCYQKFYNPTWKFYGSNTVPHTTYYYDNSDMINYYWNAFDQVIVRPGLIKAFDENKLKIISKTDNRKLMKNDKPDKENYSDHLPLFCTLKENKIL